MKNIDVKDFAPVNCIYNIRAEAEGNLMKLAGRGNVTYKNKMNFVSLTLEIKFSSKSAGNAAVLFCKNRRNSFFGQRLEHDETNYGYGVSLSHDGILTIFKTTVKDRCESLASVNCGVALANSEYHVLTITKERRGDSITIIAVAGGIGGTVP